MPKPDPAKTPAKPKSRAEKEAAIDREIEGTFPASDPPSWASMSPGKPAHPKD
jgi:hypothetical protein